MKRKKLHLIGWLTPALALLLSGCGLVSEGSKDPVLALDECQVEGLRGETRCGTLDVPENRQDPASRKITLHFAVQPAKTRGKEADPIFVLAGGPGQSAIGVAGQISGVFSKLAEKRDVVYLDQRGTGESNPLECDAEDEDVFNAVVAIERQQQILRDCVAKLAGDPRFYITSIAVQDLDAVRQKLGYGKVNLWGGSYGTRVALEYMRRFPQAVRSAVLDGVAPTDMKLPVSFASDGWAALEALFKRCEADAACRGQYPDLEARLMDFIKRMERGRMTAEFVSPATGNPITAEMDDMAVRMLVFRPLYTPQLTSLLPGALHQALDGQFEALMAQNLVMMKGGVGEMSFGMHLAVICAEDVAPITAAEREAMDKLFFGRAVGRAFLDACAVWPKGEVPKDYAEPVKSNIPALIFSGGRDPATPPRHGAAAAKHLSNSLHLVAPELGHGVSATPCAMEAITRFIRSASSAGLTDECLKKMPALPIRLPMQDRPPDPAAPPKAPMALLPHVEVAR